MNTETKKYIMPFIKNLTCRISNCSDMPALILKHYNSFSISSGDCDELSAEFPEYRFCFHQFNVEQMLSAYEPFLDWIAEQFHQQKDCDIDAFMDICHVYSLHKQVIRSYILGLPVKRTEEFIYNEIHFEKEQMVQAIINMLTYFAEDKPVIFVLNKLHRCDYSTLDVLNLLLKDHSGKIGILAAYNDLHTLEPHLQNNWNDLIQSAEKEHCVLDWGLGTNLPSSRKSRTFIPRSDQMADYLTTLYNLFLTVALEQANYFASIIHRKLVIGEIEIAAEDKYYFYLLYTKISIFSGDISNSLILCNTFNSIESCYPSNQHQFFVHYLSSLSHIYNGQLDIAREMAVQCLNFAYKTEDPFTVFRAKLLNHMVLFSGWNDVWLCELDYGVEPELLEDARKYNYLNHLAHILVYACDNKPESYSSLAQIDKDLTTFQKGIEIAEELGNYYLLLAAYRKNLMIASTNGYFDISRYYAIEKIQPLVIKTHNRFEEGNVYNDLGYNSCATEKYITANEYFNQALAIFCELDKIEYIGETLYNMAINGIMAEDYQFATHCLELVISIINIFHSESLRVAHISKIMGLKALCSLRMGNLYNCRMCLNTAYQFLEHIIKDSADMSHFTYWDDDLFLYHLCSGIIAVQENNYKLAKEEYDLAYIYGGPDKGGSVFYYNMYAEEMALLYHLTGEEEKAQSVLSECIAYFDKRGYHDKQKKMLAIKNHETYEVKPLHLDFTTPGIVDQIQKLIVDNRTSWVTRTYQKKIAYLTSWQKLQNSMFNSENDLIQHSVASIKSEFNLDHLLLVRMTNQNPVILYSDCETELNDTKLNILVDYFCHNRTAFTTSKLNRTYFEYESITSLFDQSHLCAMMGVPLFVNEQLEAFAVAYILMSDNWGVASNGIVIDSNEVAIFEVLFRQLTDTIDRFESHQKIKQQNVQLKSLNMRLRHSAISDQLTGLLNRQGFQELITEEINHATETDKDIQMTIVYCDLDKFKYSNDTFGHIVGDKLLVAFAKVLSRVSEDQGYAIRYGGDEFLLLLTHSQRNRVEEIVQNIYNALEESEGFRKEIEAVTHCPVELPVENQLSTSIGVAFAKGTPSSELIYQTIHEADIALYYVKEHGKRHCRFYEDIKEALPDQ